MACICPETNFMDGKGHDPGCPLYRAAPKDRDALRNFLSILASRLRVAGFVETSFDGFGVYPPEDKLFEVLQKALPELAALLRAPADEERLTRLTLKDFKTIVLAKRQTASIENQSAHYRQSAKDIFLTEGRMIACEEILAALRILAALAGKSKGEGS